MGWRNIAKMSILPKLLIKLNVISIKISREFFIEVDILIKKNHLTVQSVKKS